MSTRPCPTCHGTRSVEAPCPECADLATARDAIDAMKFLFDESSKQLVQTIHERDRLRAALRECGRLAMNPDPGEACRLVIECANVALAKGAA